MLKVIFLLFFFVSMSFQANSQVYKGIKGIEPYKTELKKIDELLRFNPNESKKIIDSLLDFSQQEKLKNLEAILYILKGTYFYYTGINDSASINLQYAIDISNEVNNSQIRSSATIRRLFVLDNRSDKKIMIGLMHEEFLTAEKNKDTLNMIYSLNGLANYNADVDSTKKSINYYLKAINLTNKKTNQYEYGFLLNNLGLLKLRLNAPEEAYEDFKKGIKISKKIKNIHLELVLRENLGNYYSKIDSTDLALETYYQSLKIAKERNFTQLQLNSLFNIGAIYRERGNLKKSDSLMQVTLDMATSRGMYYVISQIYITMAQSSLTEKNYTQIEPYLDSALIYSKYTSASEVKEQLYNLKYSYYLSQNNPEKALEFYIKRANLSDSLDAESHVQMMTEMQLKYDVEKKEIQRIEEKTKYERTITQAELKAASTRIKIGIGFIIFIVTLAIFIIYYFRDKNKREIQFSTALVNKLEEERGRIARDLHDGLGQNLIILKNKFNKLDIEHNHITDEIDTNFSETIEEVRSISRSLIPPELRRLGLQKSINKMLIDIEKSSSIIVTSDLDLLNVLPLNQAQELRLYRIIQELATNTIKHSKATALKIEFIATDSGYSIIYYDNGIGVNFDNLSDMSESLGFKSISQRLKYLNGSMKLEKQAKGFKAILKIKK